LKSSTMHKLVQALLLPLAAARVVQLSNLALPRDQHGQPIMSGETDVMVHAGMYYVYVNNWGGCADVDCCTTSGGCASCCMRSQGDPCVYTNNHTVVVYRTDLVTWEYLGVALARKDRLDGILFRPHVVYNAKDARFVMWYMNRHPGQQGYAVAVASRPEGPFVELVNSTRMHGPGRRDGAGDFQILVDDDGAAYHVRDSFTVERLTDDYLGGSGVFTHFAPPRESEGPVFFKRGGRYYVLTGSACCACKGGSSIDVFVSPAPLGKYTYLGDVGSDPSRPYDPHSPLNFVTRAQGSSVFVVPAAAAGAAAHAGQWQDADGEDAAQYVWLGTQWVTSAQHGRPRNHDLFYFANLPFAANGTIEQLHWQDTTTVTLPGTSRSA